jgi:hypothetical protein
MLGELTQTPPLIPQRPLRLGVYPERGEADPAVRLVDVQRSTGVLPDDELHLVTHREEPGADDDTAVSVAPPALR